MQKIKKKFRSNKTASHFGILYFRRDIWHFYNTNVNGWGIFSILARGGGETLIILTTILRPNFLFFHTTGFHSFWEECSEKSRPPPAKKNSSFEASPGSKKIIFFWPHWSKQSHKQIFKHLRGLKTPTAAKKTVDQKYRGDNTKKNGIPPPQKNRNPSVFPRQSPNDGPKDYWKLQDHPRIH